MSTLLTYFVPEDKEVQEKPNAFVIYADIKSIKLQDIIDNFPLPGEYYFRFKFKLDGKNIWIDFNNPDAEVPRYDDKIVIKATRISWNEKQTNVSNTNLIL